MRTYPGDDDTYRTVVDLRSGVEVLREGAIPAGDIEAALA